MSIRMDKNTVAIWFVGGEVEGQQQDWMGHIGYEEIEGKKKLVLTYRFRYHGDRPTGDPFKDNDRKSWYRLEAKDENESLDSLLAATRGIVRVVQARLGAESYDELLMSDFPSYEAFFEHFAAMPWAYSKFATKEEVKEFEQLEKK